MSAILGTAYAKLAGLVLILVACAALFAWGHHLGADAVQAKWDLANAAQTKLAVQASESARATEHGQAQAFAGIATTYLQATTHDYPSIADTLPAAVAAGAVRLRNDCPAAGSGSVPSTTAGASRVDASAAAAATQRLADAVAAVRVAEQADARERQLGAQITALQAILSAERSPPSTQP